MLLRTLGRGAAAAARAGAFPAFGAGRAEPCPPGACAETRGGLPPPLAFTPEKEKTQAATGGGRDSPYVDPPSGGPGYSPANLLLDPAAGVLKVTSTAG